MFFLTDVSLEVTWNYQNSHFSEHLLKIEPANIYMLQVTKYQNDINDVVLVLLLLTLIIFHKSFGVTILILCK